MFQSINADSASDSQNQDYRELRNEVKSVKSGNTSQEQVLPNLSAASANVDRQEFRVSNAPLTPSWATNVVMLGTGSYGTAIAQRLLANGNDVTMWGRSESTIDAINNGQNSRYLSNVELHKNFRATTDLDAALSNRGVIIIALPSDALPEVLSRIKPHPDSLVVSLTKGFVTPDWTDRQSKESLLSGPPAGLQVFTVHQYMNTLPDWSSVKQTVVLSGPGFARNIAQGCLFSLTAASTSVSALERISTFFQDSKLLLGLSLDPVGVEIAGAMKNAIAIGAGVLAGLRDEKGAPIHTNEGIEAFKQGAMGEALSLSRSMGGAKHRTGHTAAGWPDLNISCSEEGRNFTVGLELAKGRGIVEIVTEFAAQGKTAEGIAAAWAAKRLSDSRPEQDGGPVYTPIINSIVDVLTGLARPSTLEDAIVTNSVVRRQHTLRHLKAAEESSRAPRTSPADVIPFRVITPSQQSLINDDSLSGLLLPKIG